MASEVPTFEVERFEPAGDRVEVAGRWYGVRGRRFVRPTLEVPGARPRLALLEHKPWAPLDGEPWIAAFAWDGEGADLDGATLAVAPDIAVALGAPGGARPRRPAQPVPAAPPRDEAALRERDAAIETRDAAIRARDAALEARDTALRRGRTAEREAGADAESRFAERARRLQEERDAALREREAIARERDALRTERRTLRAELDEARRERDAAVARAEQMPAPGGPPGPRDAPPPVDWVYRGLVLAALFLLVLLVVSLALAFV